MWQYSNIPYINDYFILFYFVLKLLHYLPKSSHFEKTDLSATVMIKKLLKQNFQAIPVQWC